MSCYPICVVKRGKSSVVTRHKRYVAWFVEVLITSARSNQPASSSLRTPHDVVIAVPVSSFVLLHSTVLVGFHAGKVPADGPLTLARIQARIVRSGSGGRLPVHRRHHAIGLGRRQRRHLSEQISQVIHRGVAVWRCELLTNFKFIFHLVTATFCTLLITFSLLHSLNNWQALLHNRISFGSDYHKIWCKQRVGVTPK